MPGGDTAHAGPCGARVDWVLGMTRVVWVFLSGYPCRWGGVRVPIVDGGYPRGATGCAPRAGCELLLADGGEDIVAVPVGYPYAHVDVQLVGVG